MLFRDLESQKQILTHEVWFNKMQCWHVLCWADLEGNSEAAVSSKFSNPTVPRGSRFNSVRTDAEVMALLTSQLPEPIYLHVYLYLYFYLQLFSIWTNIISCCVSFDRKLALCVEKIGSLRKNGWWFLTLFYINILFFIADRFLCHCYHNNKQEDDVIYLL